MGFLDRVLGKQEYRCDACGGTFPSKAERTAHAAKAHPRPAALRCEACGGTFPTREALAAHGKKDHGM